MAVLLSISATFAHGAVTDCVDVSYATTLIFYPSNLSIYTVVGKVLDCDNIIVSKPYIVVRTDTFVLVDDIEG